MSIREHQLTVRSYEIFQFATPTIHLLLCLLPRLNCIFYFVFLYLLYLLYYFSVFPSLKVRGRGGKLIVRIVQI